LVYYLAVAETQQQVHASALQHTGIPLWNETNDLHFILHE